jgi:hypothetical protein
MKNADSTQAITREGRMLLATIAGSATPVHAATHAAKHSGHFGSRIAITPGKAVAAPFNQRAGPSPALAGDI